MIVFDLECQAQGHRFEGWFGSSRDFADQQARGLVCCPECGSPQVAKAVMAPNVARKGNQIASARPAAARPAPPPALPEPVQQALAAVAAMQAEALKSSRWVGGGFAEQSRAMHYGEREAELIHGQATIEEAHELIEEGIPVQPLLIPVVPPEQAN